MVFPSVLQRVAVLQVFLLLTVCDERDGSSFNFHNVRPPAADTKFCMTKHHFTSHGKTMSVTKRCAAREDCQAVGCRHRRDTGHTECVSCCEGMVCNVNVPTNHTNAVLNALSSSAPPARAWKLPSFTASLFTLLVLW